MKFFSSKTFVVSACLSFVLMTALLASAYARLVIGAFFSTNRNDESTFSIARMGQLGDSFGIVTSLASVVTLPAIFLTFLLQVFSRSEDAKNAEVAREQERKIFEADRKHAAQLSVISSLIHARSTMLANAIADRDHINESLGKSPEPNAFLTTNSDDLTRIAASISQNAGELLLLTSYAEGLIGWNAGNLALEPKLESPFEPA